MTPPPTVILYRYETSPYARKIENILTLKKIPFKRVNTLNMLPRPELSEYLGVAYRRIPILSIGNDVYCDTNLIAPILEARFPPEAGYGTIYPNRKDGTASDTGIIKALARFYSDRVLFMDTIGLIDWTKLPEAFLKDRSEMIKSSGPVDMAKIETGRRRAESALNSHLTLLEEQLRNGRQWLMETETPSLADLSVQFLIEFGMRMPGADTIFSKDRFPLTLAWVARFSTYIQGMWVEPEVLSGLDAATTICNASHESENSVGFDEIDAARFNLHLGDRVGVAPDDYGTDHVTEGKLVGLSAEEIVLEVQGSKGTNWCHFPRFGFTITRL